MTQKLTVNQKEYLPSVELGKKFSYSPDYISKLARDEKVLGTRIGRQWFVEPESLRIYLQQLEVEKRINQENLRRQRKIEHQKHAGQKNISPQIQVVEKPPLIVALKALAIVFCGALVGVLMLTVHTHELGGDDISSGARSTARQVAAKVSAGFSIVTEGSVSDRSAVATPLIADTAHKIILEKDVGPRFDVHGQYATLPVVEQKLASSSVVDKGTFTEPSDAYLLPFSDDLVVEDSVNELRVRPVFRDSMGELYQLSAIPIATDGSEE